MPAKLTDNAVRILEKRYLDGGESIDGMWDRVSGGKKDYKWLMEELLFLPNSPTLFNMGTKSGGTLSACFVFDIEDCLLGDWPNGGLESPFPASILGTTFKAACVAKAGGGVGYYLGNIRPAGSPVRSTHKKACGPVQVLYWLHQLRSLITQGGKRDLAQMGILPCWHEDVRKFIHCKDEDPQGLSSFNISVSWTDDFLKKVDFSDPDAKDDPTALWWEQCRSAWRTGDPGMFFFDTTNRANATPHLGDINATNPCGETPNLSNEPCNLGSLALLRFVRKGPSGFDVDWDKLSHCVRLSIRFMDDILDWNVFPHPDITKMALSTRKLGLGVMGWADMLALLRVPYDSEGAVDLASSLMSFINSEAATESSSLSVTKGPYPAWESSPPEVKTKFLRCRNSTRTSIAPTGTISIIAGCEPSIEPHFALERERTTYEGIKMKERVEDWLGDLGGFVPRVANEIGLEWHIRHQAAFQAHTDLGVSKTINMPNSATVRDVSEAYRMMWQSGCKGGTIFRDGCRSEQVLVAKKTSVYSTSTPQASPPPRKKLPRTRNSVTHKMSVGGVKGYLTVGLFDDGTPGEIFVQFQNRGSSFDGILHSWAKTFSLALQHGASLEALVALHRGSRFDPAGITGDPDVPICSSVVDYICGWLLRRFLPDKAPGTAPPVPDLNKGGVRSGQFCPDCGSEMVSKSGCLVCVEAGCGFSKCG